MPSTLTWVDHDAAARERSLRILSLFQEKESRDELGLGSVRDAFADRLFPGTSTIQTRLRYMLFVPWIYSQLEHERVRSADIAARARKAEIALIKPLTESEDSSGVFGNRAGSALQRLPSSIYWAGLGAWGIRRFDGSQEEYHRALDALYARREHAARRRHQDDDLEPEAALQTWHPRVPAPPNGFPDGASFALTREEAEFILDRIASSQKDSLLAHLVLRCKPADVAFPWKHPERAGFSEPHREWLDHARRFSKVMQGAAFLYNLALAEIAKRDDLIEVHRANLVKWAKGLDRTDIRAWSLARLFELTMDQGHTITIATRQFIQAWVELAAGKPETLADDSFAKMLVERRERKLKGVRSRFTNVRARDQWSGYAGTARLSYRWSTVRTFLEDLHAARTGR